MYTHNDNKIPYMSIVCTLSFVSMCLNSPMLNVLDFVLRLLLFDPYIHFCKSKSDFVSYKYLI